jgi:hypothetical protein
LQHSFFSPNYLASPKRSGSWKKWVLDLSFTFLVPLEWRLLANATPDLAVYKPSLCFLKFRWKYLSTLGRQKLENLNLYLTLCEMFESNYFPLKQSVTVQLFPLPCAVLNFRISLHMQHCYRIRTIKMWRLQ